MQPIDKAYSYCYNDAKTSLDVTLEDKKKLIFEHMTSNKEKYNKIKANAEQIQ
jgi:hypothetical protein